LHVAERGRHRKENTRERARNRGRAQAEETLAPSTADALADPVENFAEKKESPAYEAAEKLYKLIVKGYDNKEEQGQAIEEYWNIYNCKPDDNQQYTGNSQGYIPAVRDAINARAKRALKQLFPSNHKHVDGLSSDRHAPYTQLALLEHYIRKTNLRSIVRTDLVAGDVTGQWNLMLDWTSSIRNVTKLVRRNPLLEQIDGEERAELELPGLDEEEDTEEEDVLEEGPEIVDFATEDLCVLPPTCTDLQKAHAVTVKLRLSKEAMERMVDEGVFVLPAGTEIADFLKPDQQRDKRNPAKRQANDAGVKSEGTAKFALVFQTYAKLDLGGKRKEEAIIFFAGPEEMIGIIRNPLWSGKRPIFSVPVDRVAGSFFGKSKIEPVKFLQWNLNDFWLMGQDSAMYSLLPIWSVDPLKTPQWSQLVMGLAAVWPVAPDDIKPITAPQLWKDSAQICDLLKRQIWESLDVNEMMMGRMPAGRKNNQLMGAMQQEQSVNITDHAQRYEDCVLNPLVEMMFEFDQQYRTKSLMVETRGEIGAKAALEEIPVPQWGERFFFRWTGTEFMNGVQRLQQKIAWMNVLKGIPPQLLNGRTLDVTPILEEGTETIFGPEVAPRILVDQRNQFRVDPEIEDEMLHNGFAVEVHEADDDVKHLQSHMRAANLAGDPLGMFKQHMMAHYAQLMRKREMAMVQQKGVPGSPGGGQGAAPPQGAAGAPRPGALPAPGRPAQQPAGAVPADQIADGAVMGRG
jgi:hypothetical protein